MTTTVGRQWSVFYAYTAWTVVGVVALFPLGVALFLDMRIPVAAADAPVTTAVLCGQIALGAWSAWRAMKAWAAADAPTERDRWGIRRVGVLPSDLSLGAAAVPSAVIAGTVLLGGTDPRLLVLSLSLLAATAAVRWRWEIGLGVSLVFTAAAALRPDPLQITAAWVLGDSELARYWRRNVLEPGDFDRFFLKYLVYSEAFRIDLLY